MGIVISNTYLNYVPQYFLLVYCYLLGIAMFYS